MASSPQKNLQFISPPKEAGDFLQNQGKIIYIVFMEVRPMSKWTEVRDGMLAALDASDVVESAKQQIVESLSTEGMAALESVADKFVTQVQAQAASETGWNAIRDKFVLPLLINGTIWGIKFVMSKSTSNEQKTA